MKAISLHTNKCCDFPTTKDQIKCKKQKRVLLGCEKSIREPFYIHKNFFSTIEELQEDWLITVQNEQQT